MKVFYYVGGKILPRLPFLLFPKLKRSKPLSKENKMFWEVELTQKVRIQPTELSSDIKKIVIKELQHSVEGQITEECGLILSVEDLIRIDAGTVSQRTGYGIFTVHYKAIVFRPHSKQIIIAEIEKINPQGALASAGPLDIMVCTQCLPNGYVFDNGNNTFKNEQYPNQVFQPGVKIRVKLLNVKRGRGQGLYATGTTNEIGLGYLM